MLFIHSLIRGKNLRASPRAVGGYSSIELLAVVSLIAFLAVLLVSVSDDVRSRAEKAHCIANLRALHVAFAAYVQDHRQWPQEPEEGLSDEQFGRWWVDKLLPYTGDSKVWFCPTDLRLDPTIKNEIQPRISYTPAMFDEHEFTPYRWSKQPWAIEIGDFHGGGNLILFPDGSVKGALELMPAAR